VVKPSRQLAAIDVGCEGGDAHKVNNEAVRR